MTGALPSASANSGKTASKFKKEYFSTRYDQGYRSNRVGSEETERVKLINCRIGGYSEKKVIKPSKFIETMMMSMARENPKYYIIIFNCFQIGIRV